MGARSAPGSGLALDRFHQGFFSGILPEEVAAPGTNTINTYLFSG